MPSSYTGFDALIDLNDGTTLPITTAFSVLDVTDVDPSDGSGAISLAGVTPDGSGTVASGTAAVAVGRTLRFTWRRAADELVLMIHRITT
jgi:hypothetical protein